MRFWTQKQTMQGATELTEGDTIGPTRSIQMLHRRRMNSFSVEIFFCSLYLYFKFYVLAYIIDYIFVEEAWKRGYAGNEA